MFDASFLSDLDHVEKRDYNRTAHRASQMQVILTCSAISRRGLSPLLHLFCCVMGVGPVPAVRDDACGDRQRLLFFSSHSTVQGAYAEECSINFKRRGFYESTCEVVLKHEDGDPLANITIS